MITAFTNPCIRCGKDRIISKTWKEKIKTSYGTTVIVHTESVCPDSKCQVIVNKQLAEKKLKKEEMNRVREERLQERKNRHAHV